MKFTKLSAELINPNVMPTLLREMIELIGCEAALKLGEVYNGIYLYVPIVASENHALAKVIGQSNFEILVDRWGGCNLDFPKIDAAFRQIKHHIVRSMSDQNFSVADIALETGYTQRRVLQLRQGMGLSSCNDDQYDLFEMEK